MLAPTFSAFVTALPPDRLAASVAGAQSKEDPMVSNTAVLLLSVGYLLTMPALAFAQDDLMAKARQQFEPIPTAAPELPGNAATPRKGRTREDALLRSATVREPYHQLQLMPQSRAWWCRRAIHLDRTSLATWRSQCPHGAQCGIQQGPVLGWPGQGPRTAGRGANGQSGGDGLTRGACGRAAERHSRLS